MEPKTKYFFDTEFIEDGKTIDLISIGVVCEDGREFYAESTEVNWLKASQWVVDNVLPHLWHRQADKKPYNQWSRDGGVGGYYSRGLIADELINFVSNGAHPPEFWAYYGDYDWVVLMWLYGPMINHPDGWPMFNMDIMQFATMLGLEDSDLPVQTSTAHNALEDARHVKVMWEFLNGR